MKEEILDIAKKLYHNHLTIETGTELLLGLLSVSGSYTKKDMEASFDAGGDWRMACKNLTDGVIDKIEWSENNLDFEEFINNYR